MQSSFCTHALGVLSQVGHWITATCWRSNNQGCKLHPLTMTTMTRADLIARWPILGSSTRMHTKGVMQQHATLRRVLRRFSNSKCFLEGFLDGTYKGFQKGQGFLEGSILWKALRRCSEGRNTFFCRVRPPSRAPYQREPFFCN